MKVKQLFLLSRQSGCFGVALLLVFLAVAIIFGPQNAAGQHAAIAKLTLSQVEGLVAHHVPDSTMQTAIQTRGLAFTPDPATVELLRSKGAGPLTLSAIVVFFPKPTLSAETSGDLKDLPEPTDYVNDYAGVFSPEARARLDRICGQLDHSQANAQVAVVTIHTLDGADVADYAKELFNRWGIGHKGSNRGVLALLAVNDRKWNITVGDGLESILPDAKAADIGREVVPLLRANDFDGAAILAVDKVAQIIDADANMTQENAPGPVQRPMSQNTPPGSLVSTPATKVNISADVAAGLLLQKTEPVYPPIAKVTRIQGTVVMQATISETGTVESLRVVSGPAMLQQPALDAVKSWRFKPYLLNDKPVEVETTVSLIFSLGG